MGRTVGIGIQDFKTVIENDYFYVDKTSFLKEWWESGDSVTLITRPRRFGKTLTMSMVERFFSIKYAGERELFEQLSIWQEEKYRALQGSYPVISLSFANIKERDYQAARYRICQLLVNLYSKYSYLKDSDVLTENDKKYFDRITIDMNDGDATLALYQLSDFLFRYYGKKVIILLDEYDTPMQEAYVDGFWEDLAAFTRSLFNATLKTNPWLERAIMTGITRVSKESVFSDLNNLKVISTTSEEYAESFGFTEKEVFAALDEYGLEGKKREVKEWYDGFSFGSKTEIYNPWSILNYLDTGKLSAYWANTSSNSLAGKLIRESDKNIKQDFERLLQGETITVVIDEQIVYNQLTTKKNAIWSLLLASGYLKVNGTEFVERTGLTSYHLALTNKEVRIMFENIVRDWFSENSAAYNDFIKALLTDDVKAMNRYMNQVAMVSFSYFDTGKNPSAEEPERFYHGFVLGLMVELADSYVLTSNRESGFGRYDIMLEPREKNGKGIIIEFKVQDEDEKELSETVEEALTQIERKKYAVMLEEKGIRDIRKYGFAFCGKKVLIGAR